MALIDCPECGHQVSSSAAACPECGHPIDMHGADLVRALQARETDGPDGEAMERDNRLVRQRPWAWVTLTAGIGQVVGSLLPWATLTAPFVGTINVTATDGDGMLTLVAGLVVGLVGIFAIVRGTGIPGIVTLFLILVLSAIVAVIDLGSVNDLVTEVNADDFGVASVGIGLWLVTLSSIVGFVGAGGLLSNRR